MFRMLKRISTNPYAIGTVALQGAAGLAAGLIQDNAVLIAIGGIGLLLFLALVVGIRLVLPLGGPLLEGEFVVPQQPQLPDVQAHTRPHTDLAKVA
jgi:hypothetical protein